MRMLTGLLILMTGVGAGCLRVKTDPVEIKPIHITVDVNLKVQKELNNFFGDIDAADPTLKSKTPDSKPQN